MAANILLLINQLFFLYIILSNYSAYIIINIIEKTYFALKYFIIMLYLIGFMGVGKTTIGKQLSKQYNISLIDTDEKIKNKYKTSITEIFKNNGENIFRKIEADILRDIPKKKLVSCGGGLPTYKNNMKFINQTGFSIYLKASKNELFNRISKNDNKRPLIQNKTKKELKFFIEKTLADREKFYLMADYTIDTTNLSINEVLTKINALRISI